MTTKDAVLGGLVHRALTMPFEKPAPCRKFGEVPDAASMLVRALRLLPDDDSWASVDGAHDWSRAVCLVDSGGPYWSALADEFFSLGCGRYEPLVPVQEAVLERVVPAAGALAEELARVAERRGWEAVWGEMPLAAAWDGPGFGVTRPDLVAALGRTAAAVDLKVTSMQPTAWLDKYGDDEDLLARFRKWDSRITRLGYEAVSWWLAIVQVDWDGPTSPSRSMWRYDAYAGDWAPATPRRRRSDR